MRALAGQDPEQLFKSWLNEHTMLINRVACGFAATQEDRRDLTQEILLQLWRSLPRYEARAKVSTWIYRVALNTALGWRRKERKHANKLAFVEIDELAMTSEPPNPARDRELLDSLYKSIAKLPKLDTALMLMYLDDLSGYEMAAIFGISEENVRVRLSRARKLLSGLMKAAVHES